MNPVWMSCVLLKQEEEMPSRLKDNSQRHGYSQRDEDAGRKPSLDMLGLVIPDGNGLYKPLYATCVGRYLPSELNKAPGKHASDNCYDA